MRPSSAKAKGRTCRRCRKDYVPSFPLQKVCDLCRTLCSTCGVLLTEENQDKRSKENRKAFRCKPCVAEGVRSTPNRKEWQRSYDLNRKYGLSTKDFKLLSQNGCAICGDKSDLVVDHCHVTGKVRGVLCSSCNKGLGFFRDSQHFLTKAKEYLHDTSL